MNNSAKGLEFRKQIQEGWFNLRLRRLSNALETKSQDIYHHELGQLLLSMDELLNLPDSYNVAIGHYTPRQIEPQIILKFQSRESDYLLNN